MMKRRARQLGLTAVVVAAVVAAILVFAPLPAFVGAIFAQDDPSPIAGQRVSPVVARPVVRIAVAGDTGTGDAAERATAAQMVAEARTDPYDALLILGDMVYENGDAAMVGRKVTGPFDAVLDRGAKLLPVLGNHDVRSGEQAQIMHELGRLNPWYAARIGPMRILVLDSNQVQNPAQEHWLRRALAARQPAGTWTLVAMHHPAYSSGYHGSDLAVRRTWSPLFVRAHVPLVLAGHDHDYERTRPQHGVTYVVSGAGAKLRWVDQSAFTAVSSSTRHYLDLLVYRDRLVVRAIDQSGRLVDRFAIHRSSANG